MRRSVIRSESELPAQKSQGRREDPGAGEWHQSDKADFAPRLRSGESDVSYSQYSGCDFRENGAGEGIRTLDFDLGKVAL